jgi:signal recognition particle receptor subunit beta
MASLNPLTREVVFKIVFYGPGLGGKTTTLQHIHSASKPEHRGKMVSLATPMDRTLYFDFLPIRVPLVHGMHVRLQLFTVPGQVYFGATRKLVLTGADGVVFVADSQPGRQDANHEALEDLVMNLADHNLSLLNLPHTFHWNKRDIPDVVPLADLDRSLNRQGVPSIGTVATTGDGVFEGLERITRLVFQAYEAELPKSEVPSVDRPAADRAAGEETTIADALRGLAEAPMRARAGPPEAPPAKSGASSSRGGQGAPPSSSLESIPNPIPRRQTGSFESPTNGAPPSSTQSQSRGTPPSSRAPGRVTPAPSTDTTPTPSRAATPSPPRAVTAPAPAARASEVLAGSQEAAVAPPASSTVAQELASSLSFALLWSEGDRDVVRQLEAALGTGDPGAALLVCDVLVTRLLASAAGMTGNAEAPRDPGLVVLLLGLDGRRYLAFRAAVRGARAHEPSSMTDALEAYGFALEVRRALAAVGL